MARTSKTPSGGTKGAAKTATTRSKISSSAKAPAKSSVDPKTDAATEPKAVTNGQTTKKSAAAGLIFLLVIAAAGGAGYLTYPHWYPALAAKVPGLPKLQSEDSRVAGLSERIASLETQTDAIKAKGETITRLEQERKKLSRELAKALVRLETVEKSITAVRKMAEAAASVEMATEAKQSLQRLSDRLASLEKAEIESRAASTGNVAGNSPPARADRAGRAAIILAIGQLREASSRGIAYSREIEAVKALAENDTGLAAGLMLLDRHAKTGVATLSILRDEFKELAGKTVTRARAQTASGWLNKIVARVGALATLRRTDGSGEPDSVETLVAQAESRLEAGELAAAVAAVAAIVPLSTDAGAIVAPWLGRAKTRLTIERALAALHIHVVSTLGGADKEALGGANKETLSGAAKE